MRDSDNLGKAWFYKYTSKRFPQQYRHADGRNTTLPFHQGRDISPILLQQIAKDIGLTVEEFLKYK